MTTWASTVTPLPCSATLARYQADLGSPFVTLPLLIAMGSRVINYQKGLAKLFGQPWTQAVGSFLVGVDISPLETRVQAISFNHISRVLQNRLGSIYPTSFYFSSMLCSPRPFWEAFRAVVVVTRMTLLLMLTSKSLLWKRYKRPFHGARETVTRCHIVMECNRGWTRFQPYPAPTFTKQLIFEREPLIHIHPDPNLP